MTAPGTAWREPARHALLYLTRDGWAALAARAPTLAATRGLRLWAAEGHPVMRRRAQPGDDPSLLPVAVALPTALGRARLGFGVSRADVATIRPPPALDEALPGMPGPLHARGAAVLAATAAVAPTPRLFGSAMWQQVTGLAYLHERSDLDLLWNVPDAPDRSRRIDRLVASLLALDAAPGPRLDGEIVLDGDRAVNWRELATGGGGELLVKTADSVRMMSRAQFLARETATC